jgi:hypothetical protein
MQPMRAATHGAPFAAVKRRSELSRTRMAKPGCGACPQSPAVSCRIDEHLYPPMDTFLNPIETIRRWPRPFSLSNLAAAKVAENLSAREPRPDGGPHR